nr:hypothetical protein [Pelotomaculum sp. FP]
MNFPGDTDTKRFREIAEDANGFGNEKYYPLMGILKGFKEFPPIPAKVEIIASGFELTADCNWCSSI